MFDSLEEKKARSKQILEEIKVRNLELKILKREIFFLEHPKYKDGDIVEVDLGGKTKIVAGELEYDADDGWLKIAPYKKGTEEKSFRRFNLYKHGDEIIRLIRRPTN